MLPFTEVTELHKLHVFLCLVPYVWFSRRCLSHSSFAHVSCFTTPSAMVCFPALSISSIFSRPLHQFLVFPRKRPLCSRLHYIKYSYWVELQTTYLDYTFSFIVTPITHKWEDKKSALGKHLPHASSEETRGVLPYMGYIGMRRCEWYGFQAVYSWIGYVNQSVWV